MDGHGKFSATPCSHKARTLTQKAATKFETFISYKSPIVQTQSVTDNSTEQSPFFGS